MLPHSRRTQVPHRSIQARSPRYLRRSALAVPPMPIRRRCNRRRLRSHLFFHLLLSTPPPSLPTLPRRNELAHPCACRRHAGRRASASSWCPRGTGSLIPQCSFRICPKGLRFVTVPLSFVTCPDVSRSCPLFIHMHSTLRLTHIAFLWCLCSLVVRLLFRFAHS